MRAMHVSRSNTSGYKTSGRFTPYASRPRHPRDNVLEKTNIQVEGFALPTHSAQEVEKCILPNRDFHVYTAPHDVTYSHHDFVREDASPRSFTLALVKAITLCRNGDSTCRGCVVCVSQRCFWCKNTLSEGSCTLAEIEEIIPAALEFVYRTDRTRFYYKVTLLTAPPVKQPSKYVFVKDETCSVCTRCLHETVADPEPVCHDEAVMEHTNIFKLNCSAIENCLDKGLAKQLDKIELYSYRPDGSYYKLPPKDLVKVLETCRYRNLEDEDQIVYYGRLEEDPAEDTRISSQVPDLTPSEIAKLVADCSE